MAEDSGTSGKIIQKMLMLKKENQSDFYFINQNIFVCLIKQLKS